MLYSQPQGNFTLSQQWEGIVQVATLPQGNVYGSGYIDQLKLSSSHTITTGVRGSEISVSSASYSGDADQYISPLLVQSTGVTEQSTLIVYKRFSGSTTTPTIYGEVLPSTYSRNNFYYNGSSWVWRTRDSTTGDTGTAKEMVVTSPVNGNIETRVFVYSVIAGTKVAYLNGKIDASSAITSGFTSSVPMGIYLNGMDSLNNNTNYGSDSKISLFVRFTRALTASEVKRLSDNPWQLFASPRKILKSSGVASTIGSIVYTESNDITSISVSSKINSSVVYIEANDISSSSIIQTINIAGSYIEQPDISSVLANSRINAVSNTIEQNDTSLITVSFNSVINVAYTETGDTFAITGMIGNAVVSSLIYSEQDDTTSLVLSAKVNTSISYIEANDVLSSSVSVGSSLSCSIIFAEQDDSAAISNTLTINNTISFTETSDALNSTGEMFVNFLVSFVEQSDFVSVQVDISNIVQITGVVVESDDTAYISSQLSITGNASYSETPDTFIFVGVVGSGSYTVEHNRTTLIDREVRVCLVNNINRISVLSEENRYHTIPHYSRISSINYENRIKGE